MLANTVLLSDLPNLKTLLRGNPIMLPFVRGSFETTSTISIVKLFPFWELMIMIFMINN